MDVRLRSVLRETFQIFGSEWPRLVAFAAAVLLPAFALSLGLEHSGLLTRTTIEADGTVSEVYWGVWIVDLATTWIGYPLIEGGVAVLLRRGEPHRSAWRAAAVRTFLSVPALVFCYLAAFAGVAAGLILLIVPGLVVLARTAVVLPVVVLERRGLSALVRSWRLVRGNSSTALGLAFSYALLYVAIYVAGTQLPSHWYLALVALDVVLVPLRGTSSTVLYYRLLAANDIEPARTVAGPSR